MSSDLIFTTTGSTEWVSELATARLRWHGDTLQQAWEVRRSVDYIVQSVTEEWRDVPRVAVAATADPRCLCLAKMGWWECPVHPPKPADVTDAAPTTEASRDAKS